MSQTVRTSSIFSRSSVCTFFGEGLDGAAVTEIAPLRRIRHHEMVFDEPGDGLSLGVRHTETLAELARDDDSGLGVILLAALGDVMAKQGEIECRALLDRGDDGACQRMLLDEAMRVQIGKMADNAQQMFIDREVMIHVELHQRDDAAEIRDEAAEHASLIHQPQHDFR